MSITAALLPNYHALCLDLKNQHVKGSVAEWHGRFCGLCCVPSQYTVPTVIDSTAEHEMLNDSLKQLYKITQRQFAKAVEENRMSLSLLLPDDETPLAERITALSQWSQGFLSGLGEGGLHKHTIKLAGLSEVLTDIASIANIHFNAQGSQPLTEEDEQDYTELSNYLSAAIFSIHLDLLLLSKEAESKLPTAKTIH